MPFPPPPNRPVTPRKPGKYFKVNGELVKATDAQLKAIEELAEFLDENPNETFLKSGGVAITERGNENQMPNKPRAMPTKEFWS